MKRTWLVLPALLCLGIAFASDTSADRCGPGHGDGPGHQRDNWASQCGFFQWEGRGFDFDAWQWIWQRPAKPRWPNVVVTANISPHADDDDDDDRDRPGRRRFDFEFGDCDDHFFADDLRRGQRPPPASTSPRATLWLQDYKIHFHIGDLGEPVVAHITGELTFTGMPMLVGLHLPGKADKLEGGIWEPTGRILGGMVPSSQGNDHDRCSGRPPRPVGQPFDLEILMRERVGANTTDYYAPFMYGPVPGGTEPESLYWFVDDTEGATHHLDWQVKLFPAADQAPGHYWFDPEIILTPAISQPDQRPTLSPES